MLEHWDIGRLEYWNIGILEYGNIGTFEYGIILVSFRNSFWDHLGSILGSFFVHFGIIFGSVAIWPEEHSEVDYDMQFTYQSGMSDHLVSTIWPQSHESV